MSANNSNNTVDIIIIAVVVIAVAIASAFIIKYYYGKIKEKNIALAIKRFLEE